MDDVILNAELVVVEGELRDVINGGFKVCCPKCHSQEYDIYPTGCYIDLKTGKIINEDIKWKCSKCGEVWASGFIKKEKNVLA